MQSFIVFYGWFAPANICESVWLLFQLPFWNLTFIYDSITNTNLPFYHIAALCHLVHTDGWFLQLLLWFLHQNRSFQKLWYITNLGFSSILYHLRALIFLSFCHLLRLSLLQTNMSTVRLDFLLTINPDISWVQRYAWNMIVVTAVNATNWGSVISGAIFVLAYLNQASLYHIKLSHAWKYFF